MTLSIKSDAVTQQISDELSQKSHNIQDNLEWLKKEMHPLFFTLNKNEIEALSLLTNSLHNMKYHKRLLLLDTIEVAIIAQLKSHGSLHKTLQEMPEKDISYAEITTSSSTIPTSEQGLEVLRFDYSRKQESEVAKLMTTVEFSESTYQSVSNELKSTFPDFPLDQTSSMLKMLLVNNFEYVRVSPSRRIARLLNLFFQTKLNDGIHLDIQELESGKEERQIKEYRLLFGIANPPTKGYLVQVLEVFNRLKLIVNRSYSLTLSNGIHPYFLSSFYISTRDGEILDKSSELYLNLQRELYNTQILSLNSGSYSALLNSGLTSGPDASLVNAMISFCHTNLAHNNLDSFSLEGITRAFHNHPEITTLILAYFHHRFNPELSDRESQCLSVHEKATTAVEDFNSGRKYLDKFRRTVFHCALSFIKNTLKTNFYVAEKHALSFRLDPIYLEELEANFTENLPTDRPYRVTFFYGRNGTAYHIGFSDIARGGWRTIITQGRDDYVTSANTMFRENYVLAHTQHLKNKDIYEGGSKMVAVLRANEQDDKETIRQQLYKLQLNFINAFFDLFVTENGKAKDPRIIDYYGEDEPIELGPDENMHDEMIELIAKQAIKRGYILGAGVMSSKHIGINHKEYGVTSLGVTKFAEVTMKALGIDMHSDEFSVKITGGPNGDVAGNCMRLLLERCPKVRIKLIIDGSGALYDPEGLDHQALSAVILQSDLDAYDSSTLHEGGFLLYRNETRKDGMRILHKKAMMQKGTLEEKWVSNDKFYKVFNSLPFSVKTDLFIPAGGRPETIDLDNHKQYFDGQGEASAKVIIEGANSFITPDARLELQRRGVVIMRDASANKCGVISSSYEIIANLILSADEFLSNKTAYVEDVIGILNDMAEREASLIISRYIESNGTVFCTESSNSISREINKHYARIFDYLQSNPELCNKALYFNAMLLHMPKLIGTNENYRNRIQHLPEKVKYAILASKLASSMVYDADNNSLYAGMIESQLERFPALTI